MKNLFYFIFAGLIISCKNDKDINTTYESNKLLDSTENTTDSVELTPTLLAIDSTFREAEISTHNNNPITKTRKDPLENLDDDFIITIEILIKYANPCNNVEYDSTFYAVHLNKRILNFNSLYQNTNDTSYYLNGKLYEGIVKVIDPEYGDNVEGNQYYTISKGRLNGPFYQQIAEGSEQLFGHYQNGKRHGSFTIMFGDVDCRPTQSVKYHMGNVQEGGDIEFLKHLF